MKISNQTSPGGAWIYHLFTLLNNAFFPPEVIYFIGKESNSGADFIVRNFQFIVDLLQNG
jgi:hypothetical protein